MTKASSGQEEALKAGDRRTSRRIWAGRFPVGDPVSPERQQPRTALTDTGHSAAAGRTALHAPKRSLSARCGSVVRISYKFGFADLRFLERGRTGRFQPLLIDDGRSCPVEFG